MLTTGGQGEQFNQTIRDFSDFSQTLSDNRTEFFDSTRALQGFISTLAENDQTVRQFNQSLADVSTMLEGEREELVEACGNLGRAARPRPHGDRTRRRLRGGWAPRPPSSARRPLRARSAAPR